MNPSAPGDVDRTRGRPTPGALFLTCALGVAAFLLFGAFAKTYTEATRETPTWPLVPLAHAAFEAIVALALLALHRRAFAWVFVGALFSFFAGVTMHRLLGGYPSCGCFGKFAIPPYVTLALDAAIVALSLGLALRAGLGGRAVATMGALILPLAVGGSVYSLKTSDPPPRAFTGSALLKESAPAVAPKQAPQTGADANDAAKPSDAPAEGATPRQEQPVPATPPQTSPAPLARAPAPPRADLTAQQALLLVPGAASRVLQGAALPEWLARLTDAVNDTGPESAGRAWLVFVYDPDCEVCKRFIPAMEQHQRFDSQEAGAALRVVMVRKADLEHFEIPDWAWPASPTTLLVRAGKIIHEWGGDKTPYPTVLQGEIKTGGAAYLDGLEKTHKALTP